MLINFKKIKPDNINCFVLKRWIWFITLSLFLIFFAYLALFSYKESRQIFKYQTENAIIHKDVGQYSENLDFIINSINKRQQPNQTQKSGI